MAQPPGHDEADPEQRRSGAGESVMLEQGTWSRPVVAVGAVVALLFAAGCGGEGSESAQPPEQAGMLRPVHSRFELESRLKAAVRAAPTPGELATIASASQAASYSGTYTVEAQVDEADPVRYDGNLLAVASGRTLECCFAANARPAFVPTPVPPDDRIRLLRTDAATGTATELAQIELESGKSVQGMYLAGDRLVALTSSAYFGTFGHFWSGLPFWAPHTHDIRIYDLSQPATPRKVFDAQIDGTFVASRRIGDQLYIVSRYAPRQLMDNEQPAATGPAAIEFGPLASLLPRITIDGDSRALVDPLRCYISTDDADGDSAVITSITVIPLANPRHFQTTCYNEDAFGAHVSAESLYLLQGRSVISPQTGYYVSRTRVHRFAIGTGAPVYRGSAEVDGTPWSVGQGDFRISESGGLLRLFTTEHIFDVADNQDHKLYVLRQSTTRKALEVVGQLPNDRRPEEIGKPSEALLGVRFQEDRAYAVTFRRSDPLYAFDLSDPADPRIAGTLELPGFSDLLHPVTPELLLGVGQAESGGVRVALFDVSRLDQPREVDGFSFGSHTWSDARIDIHAFAYLKEAAPGTDHMAIPVDQHSEDGTSRFLRSSLQLFEVHGKSNAATARLLHAGQMVARDVASNPQAGRVRRSRAFLHPGSVFYVADDDVLGALWSQPVQVNGPF
jgi:hypothetical protein